MLKNCLFFAVILFMFSRCSPKHESKAVSPKSVSVEYAYVGIPDNDDVQKMMFGNTRVRIYTDAGYTMLESTAQAPHGLQSVIVIDNKTGETHLCISLDTLKIKTIEEDAAMKDNLFGVFGDSSSTWESSGPVQEPIQGYKASGWAVSNPEFGKTIVYVTDQISPSEAMAKSPVFIRHDGKIVGFMLGSDQQFGKYSPKLRAVNIELDKPKDVAATLAAYRPVSKEEGNRLMQKAMSGY